MSLGLCLVVVGTGLSTLPLDAVVCWLAPALGGDGRTSQPPTPWPLLYTTVGIKQNT